MKCTRMKERFWLAFAPAAELASSQPATTAVFTCLPKPLLSKHEAIGTLKPEPRRKMNGVA